MDQVGIVANGCLALSEPSSMGPAIIIMGELKPREEGAGPRVEVRRIHLRVRPT